MMTEPFSCNSAVTSPIDHKGDNYEDVSISELNVMELSLPESFDDTFRLDLYCKEFRANNTDMIKNAGSKERGPRHDCNSKLLKTPCPIKGHKETPSTVEGELNMFSCDDMEVKVRLLIAENSDLKDKSRLYDSLKKRVSDCETEIIRLQTQVEQQSLDCETAITRETELRQQIIEHKRKVQLIGMDFEHTQKEAKVNLSRAEKSVREFETTDKELKALQQKYDTAIVRHAIEREELKAKADREIAKVRDESNSEIMSSRNDQKELFARETKLLCDARDYAMERVKVLECELNALRAEKQTKDVENSYTTNELERQLADLRSDLKVKSCEMNTLTVANDRLIAEVNQCKEESEKNKQAISQWQLKYESMEKQAIIERSKFEEIIRQKDSTLEILQHDDLLLIDDISSVDNKDRNSRNEATIGSERKRLVKNSFTLARKCRELQTHLQKANHELSSEKEKNDILTKKIDNNTRLVKELTLERNNTASAYILSAVNARDNEIAELSAKVKVLQNDVNSARHDKDYLASKLAEVLERREKLDEMKSFLQDMRSKTAFSEQNDIDNLSEHMVYHKKCVGR